MKARNPDLSVATLRRLLWLDVTTGRLYWRKRDTSLFKEGKGRYTADRAARIWNTRYAGKEALTNTHLRGYRCGTVLYWQLLSHRVVWALYHGYWPTGTIDHINGDPHDNRPSNLRDVEHAENMKNQRKRSTNTSGFNGVFYYGPADKFDAFIRINGKKKHIGRFETYEEAVTARRAADKSFGYHPNHGRTA